MREAPAVVYLTDLHVQTHRMAAQQLLFTLSSRILADHGQLIARTLNRGVERAWQKLIVSEPLKPELMRRRGRLHDPGDEPVNTRAGW